MNEIEDTKSPLITFEEFQEKQKQQEPVQYAYYQMDKIISRLQEIKINWKRKVADGLKLSEELSLSDENNSQKDNFNKIFTKVVGLPITFYSNNVDITPYFTLLSTVSNTVFQSTCPILVTSKTIHQFQNDIQNDDDIKKYKMSFTTAFTSFMQMNS